MLDDVLNIKPEFDCKCLLLLDALAPLSMVSNMPGKFYRSQPAPTDEMLYGLLENALGWHISIPERDKLLKILKKNNGSLSSRSGNGFQSLLQYHLKLMPFFVPPVQHYVDLWSQHVHGPSFVGGSRDYSKEAIPMMNAVVGKKVTVNDLAKAQKEPELITQFEEGQTIHLNVLRPYFPQFYISPTPREYVLPSLPYQYRIATSEALANLIGNAIIVPPYIWTGR